MSETVVEAMRVTKQYRRGKIPVSALNGIDMKVRRAEIVGVIGPSGSGKSTLLNLIGGLDRPSGGKVLVDGADVGQMNESQLAEYRLRKVGFVFQFYNLISTLTALQNVMVPMGFAGLKKEDQDSKARRLLAVVGLEERLHHMPDEMSGGEQQRVAVARALANGPSVVLADEPTGDLDSKAAKRLMELIKSLRDDERVTFMVVTHDPIVIAQCDRAYALRDGKVTHELTSKELGDAMLSDKFNRALDGIY